MRSKLTGQEKIDILKAVAKLKSEGATTEQALEQLKIAKSQYYKWLQSPLELKKKTRKYSKRKPKAFVQDVPIHQQPQQEKVLCIIGTPSEIADVIRGLK